MREDMMETIVVEVDAELLEQLNEVIRPMGLTPEMLVTQLSSGVLPLKPGKKP